jgi:hypothetical protein
MICDGVSFGYMDSNFIRAISPSRPGSLICISNVPPPSDTFFVVMRLLLLLLLPVEARRLGCLHLRGNDDDDDDDDGRCESE